VSASKVRLRWGEMPASVRARIGQLVASPVLVATNCPGGFSPGLASRLALGDGRRVFVKAMDADAWPLEAAFHRREARTAAALPGAVPAPRFLGWFDDGRWVILAFEYVDGAEPAQPWNRADLDRVVAAVGDLSRAMTPSPIALPRDHPRLGGWAQIALDRSRVVNLPAVSPWAADNLAFLAALEEEGLAAACGPSLVHFDLFPHNILLTPGQVFFVDWPHARLGAPFVDLVLVLASAAADGIDPDPILRRQALTADVEPRVIDAVVAAFAGFCLAGGLAPAPAGLQAIVDAKLRLGRASLGWLVRRHRPRGHN
jgi:Ser/Thr protein kinase RdoA (MazF antagonist)